jgi:16S rRNA (adenine1518-N6/adenine1519-N6)-dimethyltransferase
MTREPFAQYLERLEALGFKPSRSRGQNFLLDPTLHRFIADALAPGPSDLVLEIGAGLGFLTRELAPRAGHVVTVEIDPRLCALLRDEIARWPEHARVELLAVDVLGPGDTLAPEVLAAVAARRGAFLLGANLPYAISGPLLGRLPLQPDVPDRAVLLVQHEFAERLLPRDRRADGALAVQTQLGFDVELLRRVGREVFRPRPRVDSAILRLVRRADAEYWRLAPAARKEFQAFLRASFAARRKQVGGAWQRWAKERGVELPEPAREWLRARPDEVAGERYLEVWRGLRRGSP